MFLTGKVAAAIGLGGLLLFIWPSGTTVAGVIAAVALLVAIDILMAVSPRSLSLDRAGPTVVRLTQATTSTLTIANPGRRTFRGWVRDAWPPSAGASGIHRLTLPGGERRRIVTDLRPTRRGDRHAAGVTIRSLGPLRLAGRQRTRQVPGVIRVLHEFPARRHLPSRLRVLRELDGRASLRTRGQGTEFDSLRDYVRGDDVRSIDWRATARRRDLVVRTWRPEEHRRVVIVVDTSRTSAGRIGDAPRLDASMDAALLLTALAGHARDRVTVIAADSQVRTQVSGADRARLLGDVISALAPLDARLVETNWDAVAETVNTLGAGRALVVLLTTLEPSPVEEGLLPVMTALSSRHLVALASVSDPRIDAMRLARDTTDEIYDAAAAERTEALKRRTTAALAALGATVIEGTPDDLPPALADHYLALKRHGRL